MPDVMTALRRIPISGVAFERDVPARRADETGECADERRFSGAVRADQQQRVPRSTVRLSTWRNKGWTAGKGARCACDRKIKCKTNEQCCADLNFSRLYNLLASEFATAKNK
jgi:hypothetical protein